MTNRHTIRRLAVLCLALFLATMATAQTQQGFVKTKGRMVDGKLVPGKGIKGATVTVQGRTAVLVNGDDGAFSFPIPSKTFQLQEVKKNGYQLVDADIIRRSYTYSPTPLYIVMETPDQQANDQLAAERKIRRNLQRKLEEREDEIEALKAQQKITEEEYRQALQKLYAEQESNERLIADMAKQYAAMDYDQMDELNRRISDAIVNGRLTEADSLLHSKGDINDRIKEMRREQQAEAQRQEQLEQAMTDLENAKAGTQKKLDDLIADCKNYFNRFIMDFQFDSAAYYIELRAQLDSTNPKMFDEAGAVYYHYCSNFDKSLTCLQRSLALKLDKYGDNHPEVAHTHLLMGNLYSDQGILDKAQEHLTLASDIYVSNYGENHPDVAIVYNGLGGLYSGLDDHDKALEYYEKALKIQKAVLEENHADFAMTYSNIGCEYGYKNESLKALQYFDKALDVQYANFGANDDRVAVVIENIGVICARIGMHDKALEYYDKALKIKIYNLGENHTSVASCYSDIGTSYHELGNYEEALRYDEKALKIRLANLGENHPDVATSYSNIGTVYFDKGDFEEALKYYDKALKINLAIFGENHLDVATSYSSIGTTYYSMGDLGEALKYYDKALRINLANLGEDHPDTDNIYLFLGNTYYYSGLVSFSDGDYEQALEYFNKALEIRLPRLGENHFDVASTYNSIGATYSHLGDRETALKYFEKATISILPTLKDHLYDAALFYANVGNEYEVLGNYRKALENYDRALEIKYTDPEEDYDEIADLEGLVEKMGYLLALSEARYDEFNEYHCFTVTFADDADQQGLSGEYILLEYGDWNQDSPTSFFDKRDELREKPTDILVMKDGVISQQHFDGVFNAYFRVINIENKDKQAINQAYEEWKRQNRK